MWSITVSCTLQGHLVFQFNPRVVALVGDARQAKPHLEHNPLLLPGACNATPIRKLNDPEVALTLWTLWMPYPQWMQCSLTSCPMRRGRSSASGSGRTALH